MIYLNCKMSLGEVLKRLSAAGLRKILWILCKSHEMDRIYKISVVST